MGKKRRFGGLSLLALATGVFLSGARVAVAAEPELHVREGLPNLAARAAPGAGGELRVAYLGGSITAAADGWRSLTTEHLRTLFPQTKIVEIAAGLPGTGSNLGACRLDYDVLRHRPDLLFVEFAVNDTGVPPERIERTMEGIVRHVWRANPRTDIWFVYTISAPALPDLQAGKFQASARAMENVAAHYGIPSLHFGVAVVQRLAAGTLEFKAPAAATGARAPEAASGREVFSRDGVHPTAEGHRIYAQAIERSLPRLLVAAKPVPHALPAPLHADNWEHATLKLFGDLTPHGAWTQLASDDPNLRGATKNLLPPTWRAAEPGAAVELEFRGHRVGLLGIAAPDSGEFRVTIDDLPPVTTTFFDSYVTPTFCRQREWFFPGELGDGAHRLRVELLDTRLDKVAIKAAAGRPASGDATPYQPHRLTLGGVLVVGDPAP